MTEREIRFALSFLTAEQRQKLLAHIKAVRIYREEIEAIKTAKEGTEDTQSNQ